jgi:hypothetical protein
VTKKIDASRERERGTEENILTTLYNGTLVEFKNSTVTWRRARSKLRNQVACKRKWLGRRMALIAHFERSFINYTPLFIPVKGS